MADDEDEPSITEPTVDVASEEGQKEQRRRSRRKENEGERFWRGVLAERLGRQEIYRLLQAGHAFETVFAASPTGFPNQCATDHARGAQDYVMRWYFKLAQIDRAAVLLMHDENDPRFPKPKRNNPRV